MSVNYLHKRMKKKTLFLIILIWTKIYYKIQTPYLT